VYRATVGGSGYALLSSALDTQKTCTDATVKSGLTYDYIVKSVDAAGVQSAPSNTTIVTIP
jgi:fibronectin type 3 domain-containing protein